jgi:hypothetical protein
MLARKCVEAVVSETAITFHQLETQIGNIKREHQSH